MSKSVHRGRTKPVRRVSRSPRSDTSRPRLGRESRRTMALIALGAGVGIAALCKRLLRERRQRSLLSRLAAAVTAAAFERRR